MRAAGETRLARGPPRGYLERMRVLDASPPKLADFLSEHRDTLVERFEQRVARLLAPDGLSERELRNHLPDFLDAVIQALREDAWPPRRLVARNATAEEHGRQRLDVGFNLDALTREYGLLRDCIFELLEEGGHAPSLRELRILSDCVSAATADSVTQFVEHQQGVLRASQERLQAILDNAPAAVYVKDLEGRWLIANRQMEAMFGRPVSELVGKHDEEVLTPEAAQVTRANDARVLAANAALESEEVVPLADGPHTYLSLKFPLCDAEGRATAVCGISTDITERRRAQEFQQRLLGIVGHDVRGPLSAITLSAAVLLKQEGFTPGQVRAVQRISSGAERIERLVALLLDFTRAQLGLTLPLHPESVCLGALSDRVVDEVQSTHPGRGIHLEARGDTCGEWDPGRLMQVLGNLLSNALRYSPPESAVRVRIHAEGRDTVALHVHNAGPPIPPEARAALFLPFHRGPGADGGSREGMGLGLYIVREAVKAHGGSVSVESTEAEGTTFTVRLPRHPPEAR